MKNSNVVFTDQRCNVKGTSNVVGTNWRDVDPLRWPNRPLLHLHPDNEEK